MVTLNSELQNKFTCGPNTLVQVSVNGHKISQDMLQRFPNQVKKKIPLIHKTGETKVYSNRRELF